MATQWTPTFSYQPGSTDPTLGPLSLLRTRLGDTDFSQVTTPPYSAMFADQELLSLLSANQNDSIFTLCDALNSIANNGARLSVFVTLQGGGSIDRRAVARELREQSKHIRDQYINTPAFALGIEMDWDNFSARAIIWNSIQRSLGS
jgi:hypothetical protein